VSGISWAISRFPPALQTRVRRFTRFGETAAAEDAGNATSRSKTVDGRGLNTSRKSINWSRARVDDLGNDLRLLPIRAFCGGGHAGSH
jgi:hypothetical protein